MAGGPLTFQHVDYGTTGLIGPGVFISNTNGLRVPAHRLTADLDDAAVDATLTLMGPAPVTIPTAGSPTAKLVLNAFAEATSTQSVVVQPQWQSFAAGDSIDLATLNDEGTTDIEWLSTDAGDVLQTKIDLDADTWVDGELIILHLIFESTGSDLDVPSFWQAHVIWE